MLLQLSQFFPFCPPPPSPPLSPSVNPLSIVHVHESFIHVLWLVPSPSFHPFPLPLPLLQLSVPCFHASGSIFLITLFCSLDSSYKWGHMVFVFCQLAGLFHWTQWSPVLSMLSQKVDIPSFCVEFHCVTVPQFFNPLIYWWAPGLFPTLGFVNSAAMNIEVHKFFWTGVSGFSRVYSQQCNHWVTSTLLS